MTETTTVDTWIYGKLAADSTLTALIGGSSKPRIYRNVAPQSATFPYVLLDFQGDGGVVRGTGTTNILMRGTWLVKAVCKAETASGTSGAATISARVYTLLHGVTSGAVLQCTHEQPVAYTEVIDGVQYQHQGGLYLIYAQ